MFLFYVIIAWIIIGAKLADRRRWKEFYPTIQYFIIFNLFYNFLYYNKTLWAYKAVSLDFLNHTLIESAFTFIIVPITISIFLTHYPERKGWLVQARYTMLWAFIYWIIEYFFHKKGLFIYDNGWNIWWTGIFDITMFLMLRLHFKRPLAALLVSLPITVVLMLFFPPDISTMK